MSYTPRPRKLLYLSGTRADFGLMSQTLQRLAAMPDFTVSVVATGMHLSAAHGHTVDDIVSAGLPICARLPLDMDRRSGEGMALGLAEVLRGMTAVLQRERPDVLLLLGDRGEMLAAALAALHLGVVCLHLHGGERSGTIDEPMRHAISQLSHYHAVATEESAARLRRMGQRADTIRVIGAPGLDGLRPLTPAELDQQLSSLGLARGADGQVLPFWLVLFHPVVQQAADAQAQTRALVQALQSTGLPVLWLAPNADAGSGGILQALDQAELPAGSCRLPHLSRTQFLAALQSCQALVGNSSAGIIEAASLGTVVVNVGDRQRLRERSGNVIDCNADADEIRRALQQALAMGCYAGPNVYGDGQASRRLAEWLTQLPLGPAVLEKVYAD